MFVYSILAIISPAIIALLAILVLLLFGAERLPKLARSAGQAKKEFLRGQAEGDEPQSGAGEQPRGGAQATKTDSLRNPSEATTTSRPD